MISLVKYSDSVDVIEHTTYYVRKLSVRCVLLNTLNLMINMKTEILNTNISTKNFVQSSRLCFTRTFHSSIILKQGKTIDVMYSYSHNITNPITKFVKLTNCK